MGNIPSVKNINFSDVQYAIKNNNFIIINTLPKNKQHCLIKNTVNIENEEEKINMLLKNNMGCNIIIYGNNCNDNSIYKKGEQLNKLGLINVYIYAGGIFEWLILQDVYGDENFPTDGYELDLLKYKSNNTFSYLLKNK